MEAASSDLKRTLLHGLAAAAEFPLVVIWCNVLFLLTLRSQPAQYFYWAAAASWVLLQGGVILFLAAWGLRRIASSLLLLRIVGAIAAPLLAYFLLRRSLFFLLFQASYLYVPLFLLSLALLAFLYGVWVLPRHFKVGAVPRLPVWTILVLALSLLPSFVPRLILHLSNGQPLRAFPFLLSRKAPDGELVFAVWHPGPGPLTVKPPLVMPSTTPPSGGLIPFPQTPHYAADRFTVKKEELARLRSAGLTTGQLEVVNNQTSDLGGRLVVVLSQQLQQPFRFPFPAEHRSVIYLQTRDGWRKLPPEAGDSHIWLRLYMPAGQPRLTDFEIDRGDGHPVRDLTGFFW